MELRQLAYFDAVARHGSFTKAAQRLHVAQPAVSAQIRRLEAELGATLLERTTRRVALTHAGELFLARARQVLAQLDAARADLGELSAVLRGRVRIGATQVVGSLDLPAALAQFRHRYPGVSLALHSGLIAKLLGLLCYMQPLGGLGETTVARHRVEVDQLPQLHLSSMIAYKCMRK